jgi:surface polysaccharide O-acyltransferase-like enzyme
MISKGVRAVGIYLISTLVIFISFIVIRLIYLKTGKLEDFISYGYSYNYLFCYTGAIGLFVAFGKIKTEGLEKLRKMIELLSGATFGVYLIHEHINIRYLWPTWFATDKVAILPVPLFLISMLGTVVVVYLVCSMIEIIRAALSKLITKKVGKR